VIVDEQTDRQTEGQHRHRLKLPVRGTGLNPLTPTVVIWVQL